MERYDAHLRFSTLKLDIRLLFLISFLAKRMWLLYQNHTRANALDGLNIAALLYGFSLNAPVGLEGKIYMTPPIQFVATTDILTIWEALVSPWLRTRLSVRQTQEAALGTALLLLGIEDRQADTFWHGATAITWKKRTWRKTYNKGDEDVKKAKQNGEAVNLFISRTGLKLEE